MIKNNDENTSDQHHRPEFHTHTFSYFYFYSGLYLELLPRLRSPRALRASAEPPSQDVVPCQRPERRLSSDGFPADH